MDSRGISLFTDDTLALGRMARFNVSATLHSTVCFPSSPGKPILVSLKECHATQTESSFHQGHQQLPHLQSRMMTGVLFPRVLDSSSRNYFTPLHRLRMMLLTDSLISEPPRSSLTMTPRQLLTTPISMQRSTLSSLGTCHGNHILFGTMVSGQRMDWHPSGC